MSKARAAVWCRLRDLYWDFLQSVSQIFLKSMTNANCYYQYYTFIGFTSVIKYGHRNFAIFCWAWNNISAGFKPGSLAWHANMDTKDHSPLRSSGVRFTCIALTGLVTLTPIRVTAPNFSFLVSAPVSSGYTSYSCLDQSLPIRYP